MTVDTLASHYRSLTRVVQPVEARGFVPDDPDDDIVVATAIAAHANLIVSGDDDLLRLEEIANIAVVTAVDALNVVGMWANG